MFNIGAGEMIFILVAALLILGPQRLPELARGIGKFLREFRRQTDEVRSVVTREFYQMDQELHREPPRPPPPAPVPPLGLPGHAALPPATDVPAPSEGGIHPHPEPVAPVAPVPAEAIQASISAATPEAAPGEPAAEQEAGPPRFDPIPGTVARNAPKQG
jgi:sec-independent protein translocase protein TatB